MPEGLNIDWKTLIEDFRFAHPEAFLLFLLLPLYAWLVGRRVRRPGAAVSSTLQIYGLDISSSGRKSGIRLLGAMLPLIAIIIALAQPQTRHGEVKEERESIDIMLVLDVSGSMLEPIEKTRFSQRSKVAALKEIVTQFIDQRPDDRIGVIGFASQTYLVSPLTLDHTFVKEIIDLTRFNRSGTAIGEGILAAVAHLQDVKDRTRIIILVTDGENTTGISPFTAVDFPREEGIKTYAIELTGKAVSKDQTGKSQLAKVMARGGGRYYNAADVQALNDVYDEIDTLERTKVTETRTSYYDDHFMWPLGAGLALLLLQILLQRTLYLRIP